ncbi:hypothetical protein VXQ18_16800 [Brucella abortus]|nr:hypothetical protein [Brucella abortus]
MPVNLKKATNGSRLPPMRATSDAAESATRSQKALKPEMLTRAKGAVKLWKAKPLDDAANSIDVPDAWTEAKPLSTSSVVHEEGRSQHPAHSPEKHGYDTGTADGIMGAQDPDGNFRLSEGQWSGADRRSEPEAGSTPARKNK